MATLRAQEEKADGTNRVIVSKQDMRITQVIPGRITMGCIRLSNEDLKAFSRLVDVDTRVDILPDKGRERGSLSKLARDDDY